MNKSLIQLANKLVGKQQPKETAEAHARRIRETYDSLQKTASNEHNITEINAEITALTLRVGSVEQEIETISGLEATQRLYQFTDPLMVNGSEISLYDDVRIHDLHSLISISMANTPTMVKDLDYRWNPDTQVISWVDGYGEEMPLRGLIELDSILVITYLR